MTATETDARTDAASIVSRLTTHRLLSTAPPSELAWLATHGELRRYVSGDVLARKSDRTMYTFVVLSGGVVQYLEGSTTGGRRKFMEWRAGEVAGLFPYSRMTVPPGESVIEEPTEILLIPREIFAELIRECPTVTEILVHQMLDRGRLFVSSHFQDEKMISLGKLAAGLAHELNNPASAAARSASFLTSSLADLKSASRRLAALRLSDAQQTVVDRFSDRWTSVRLAVEMTPIERADREDELHAWLESRGADVATAPTLADAGVTREALEDFGASLDAETIDAALGWIAADITTYSLAAEVERGALRIHDLVSAVKRFTYMDRAAVARPVSIAQGVADTLAVLTAKAQSKSVRVTTDIPTDLPLVPAFGAELNQVWANLIDNALDAVSSSGGGHVAIQARVSGTTVVVCVIDDGEGIPSDITDQVFDAFFTTKPIGQGTGLGLDTARRIVRRHDGQIEFDSRPGHTEFRVTLPASVASTTHLPEPA
jgi:signal transduction histidine kinase